MVVIAPSEIKELRSKFPVEAHSIRQGHSNNAKTKCAWFVYLDRIAIIDRLDELFPGEWEYTMTEPVLREKHYSAIGSLTIRGITRQFNGTQKSGSFTPGDDEKGCGTDVFRRTASMWGIGSYLYNAPNIWTALPAKGDWDAQRKYEAEGKAIFTRWFNGAGHSAENETEEPETEQPFWSEEHKHNLYNWWQSEHELTKSDVLRLAGITDADDDKQWVKYPTGKDASTAIQAAWNAELEIDREQGPPDPASEYDGSDGSIDPNLFFATFTYVRYFYGSNGKQRYIELATAKPERDVTCVIARAYGRSTDFKAMVGDIWYDANSLGDYDGKEKSQPWRKLKNAIDMEYAKTQYYNTVTGLVEDNVPF